jgi:hypothetical protein
MEEAMERSPKRWKDQLTRKWDRKKPAGPRLIGGGDDDDDDDMMM